MFGKKQTNPCPMCTSWIDSFNGVAHHLAQNVDLAVVAAADPAALRALARKRGWDKLRLLSAGENTFKDDLGSEDRAGQQESTISVFTRDSDGTLRHFYSVHPRLADDIEKRGIDEYNPIWNVLDLTPQGRGNWSASLDYGTKVQAPRPHSSSRRCRRPQRADCRPGNPAEVPLEPQPDAGAATCAFRVAGRWPSVWPRSASDHPYGLCRCVSRTRSARRPCLQRTDRCRRRYRGSMGRSSFPASPCPRA